MEEAVEWIKRAPFDGGVEITLRPVFDPVEFGKHLSPELRAQNDRLRGQMEQKSKS
jgi:hypothetical protein